MKKILIWVLPILSCYTNAVICYNSIEIATFGEEKYHTTTRYVTRINGQLFYKSTGLNSSLSGIYFPFYGILSNKEIHFWYVKPGFEKIVVNGKAIDTKSISQIWNSYVNSEFGTFMNAHDSEYIEKNLHQSEAQKRFGGYDTAKTSYGIMDSNFSGHLDEPFVAELNSYFENSTKIKKKIMVNINHPVRSFVESSPPTFKTINDLSNEINHYIEDSPEDWACSNQGCCEIY